MIVNQFLKEKSGQTLRAEIHSDTNGYNVKYFINETMQTQKTFNQGIEFVEEQAQNWIDTIGVLKG
mgnify:FL=1|tara:strand:+ start:2707 stop:2904 length:198 start_codon:yes stop_codon:yes gene_type:complete